MVKSSLVASTRAALKESPKEIFNWYIMTCVWLWSFSGVAKGFDEGNIASLVTMDIFKQRFGLSSLSEAAYADTKGWIVSIATGAAVFGCLLCVWAVQLLGRKNTMLLFTAVYIAGVLGELFSTSGSLPGLYAARFVKGLGIGATTVLPPIYLSEVSPRSVRGLVTLQYACCQQLGVVFGFFFNYAVTAHHPGTDLQWRLPTGLQLVPAAVWGVGIALFAPESPRYLMATGRTAQGLETLCRLRGLPADHPYIVDEHRGVAAQLEHEAEAASGASTLDLLRETFGVLENRRRFLLMFACHVFGQWSGANAITQYSPTIFGYLGIEGERSSFLATGVYGVVKFVSVLLFSVFVIDFIGRRRSLMAGITLQIVTLAYVGAYLGATDGWTAAEVEAHPNALRASVGAIVAIYIHAVGWSIGWFSIPYLVSSEVFPLRIRSLNVSVLMAVHWAFYFACSKAMPSMLEAMDRWGAFAFFASLCAASLAYVFVAMPETSGRSLESMDTLFERPWYAMRQVAYPTAEDLMGPGAARAGEDEDEDRELGKRKEVVSSGETRHVEH